MRSPEPAVLTWRKSSASGNSGCVEVATDGRTIFVRDSKNPAGPALAFDEHEWLSFVAGARSGEFDLGGRALPFDEP